MSAAAYTPGPWAWNESRSSLCPVNPDPNRSAVHTILSPDGPYGFLCGNNAETMSESEGNFRLIESAPLLLQALQNCAAVLALEHASPQARAAAVALARAALTAGQVECAGVETTEGAAVAALLRGTP